MKKFLLEYWPWILIPFVIVILVLLAAWFLGSGDGTSPFQYNVF